MKKELELKDIACYKFPLKLKERYLPYDYDGKHYATNRLYKEECSLIAIDYEKNRINVRTNNGYRWLPISKFKPLLIPMSAMTQPMTVEGYNDGEEFVPIDILTQKFGHWFQEDIFNMYSMANGSYELGGLESWINLAQVNEFYELLAQWHFDIGNLIGQGLALDKTTYNIK